MRTGIAIKLVLGIMLVVLLVIVGYKMLNIFSNTLVGMLNNAEIPNKDGDYQLYTPEPMPTMPDYMGDDSFYDNAGSVDFGDE